MRVCLLAIAAIGGQRIWAESAIHHILSTGQSLSQGAYGHPALSTTQPKSNLMLRILGNGFNPGPANFVPEFVPLVEWDQETISSALANSIAMQTPGEYRVAVTRHGFGDGIYANLKEGSTHFETGLDQVAKGSAAAGSTPYEVTALTVIHGERDAAAYLGPAYAGFLLELHDSYLKGVRQVIPNAPSFPLITDQLSAWANLVPKSKIPVFNAQLAAAEDYSDDIVLVGPKYHLKYAPDKLHLKNISYRWLGEYYGKVYRHVVINQLPWRPLSPKRIERQGQVITATFFVPIEPLRWDTAVVRARKNYGFEYADSSAKPPSIRTVELVGPDKVRITLDRAPIAKGGYLRYAYSGQRGHAGGDDPLGIGGNLADSDRTPSIVPGTPNNLANWCVSFGKPIVSAQDPVVLLAPLDGSIVLTGTSVRLAADVFERNGLQRVDYYEGTQRVGQSSAPPYEVRWRPARGKHRIRAVAVYQSNSLASPEATLAVNELPSISLSWPQQGAVLPKERTTVLQATASDDVNVGRVAFWFSRDGGNWQSIGGGKRSGNQYTLSWTPPQEGRYRVYAQAYDNQGFARFAATNVQVVQ